MGLLQIASRLLHPTYFNIPLQTRVLTVSASLNMRVVGLISGGKDSCFNLMKCVAENHEVVALANLSPNDASKGEIDSYMYQSAGHEMIEAVSQALGLPLHRRPISGGSINTDMTYQPKDGDEVEDLYELLKEVKEKYNVQGVSVGAVLSDYQRIRVENVCSRLGLTCLAYLWCRDQMELLDEMINCGMEAVLVKVASVGLDPAKHLNKTLSEMKDHLLKLNQQYGVHVCGEGGEYETLTLDCPLYNSRIVIGDAHVVDHTKSDIAPVGYLEVKNYHLEPKNSEVTSLNWTDRLKSIPLETSQTFTKTFFLSTHKSDVVPFNKIEYANCAESWPSMFESYVHTTAAGLFCSIKAHNSGDVAADTAEAMARLGDIVKSHGMTSTNVVYALLYVSDMSLFGNINAVYSKFFGVNPPPRICVEAVLPKSSLFHAQIFCSKDAKETRHVQGVSHWAPSCIGPYSQTAKVGSHIYVSGQVPLVPGSMVTLPSGFGGQCKLAFDHVLTVAKSMAVSKEHIVSAHCYLVRNEDISVALDMCKDLLPPQVKPLFVVMPRLPRDVMVEWHVNFNLQPSPLQTSCSGGDILGDVCSDVTRNLDKGQLYFAFYNAVTTDANDLLQALRACQEESSFVPIPVCQVVTSTECLDKRHQVACVRVAGLNSSDSSKL